MRYCEYCVTFKFPYIYLYFECNDIIEQSIFNNIEILLYDWLK